MAQLLKNLRNCRVDDLNVRILKVPRSEYSIIKSLTSTNLSLIYKSSFVHSFSVYPPHDLTKEYVRISLPIQLKTLNERTNIVEYIERLDSIESIPYILFFLGQGKANIAAFDAEHQMSAHREISRVIQCRKIVKLKYPKKSPLFVTNKNLLPFYKETMMKAEKWAFHLQNVSKAPIDVKDANIAYMADDRIWRDFWNLHRRISEKENEGEDIMPFSEFHPNLIRIGDYSMAYPKNSDLKRFSFGLRDVHCFVNNALVEEPHFPKNIKDLMSDEEFCWDPMVADCTEQKSKRGFRKNKIAIVENEGEEVKPYEMKQQKKSKEKEEKIKEYKMKQSKRKMIEFDKESRKMDDLENLIKMTSNKHEQKESNVVRI